MKVSVIVGYYNRREVLKRTLDSLLNQTHSDFEVIVFDDASTDGTDLELLNLSNIYNDPRLKYVVHSSNIGFVQGLINAIDMATGEYIAIHGSGDVAAPTRLERQAAYLDQYRGVGAVGSWYTNVNDLTGDRNPVRPDANHVDLASLRMQNVYSHGEVMFRRSAYDRAGGYRPEFRFAQDIDLWLRIRREYRLATIPEFLYERHILSDGVTHNPKKFSDQARFSLLARRLLDMTPEETARTLSSLRLHGPSHVVDKADPALQKRFFWGAIDMGLAGSPSNAVISAKENLISPSKRLLVSGFFSIYGTKYLGAPVRSGANWALRSRRTLRQARGRFK